MTVLAGFAALAMATCVGYYFGRRARSTPPAWKARTGRVAVGRLAINLLVLLATRRIRRRLWAERTLSDALRARVLRVIAPLALRRSVARMFSY